MLALKSSGQQSVARGARQRTRDVEIGFTKSIRKGRGVKCCFRDPRPNVRPRDERCIAHCCGASHQAVLIDFHAMTG